jgi:hypothetical protein
MRRIFLVGGGTGRVRDGRDVESTCLLEIV